MFVCRSLSVVFGSTGYIELGLPWGAVVAGLPPPFGWLEFYLLKAKPFT